MRQGFAAVGRRGVHRDGARDGRRRPGAERVVRDALGHAAPPRRRAVPVHRDQHLQREQPLGLLVHARQRRDSSASRSTSSAPARR